MDCGAIMTGGVGPTFFCFLSCLVTPKTSSSKVKALGIIVMKLGTRMKI